MSLEKKQVEMCREMLKEIMQRDCAEDERGIALGRYMTDLERTWSIPMLMSNIPAWIVQNPIHKEVYELYLEVSNSRKF